LNQTYNWTLKLTPNRIFTRHDSISSVSGVQFRHYGSQSLVSCVLWVLPSTSGSILFLLYALRVVPRHLHRCLFELTAAIPSSFSREVPHHSHYFGFSILFLQPCKIRYFYAFFILNFVLLCLIYNISHPWTLDLVMLYLHPINLKLVILYLKILARIFVT
jgi:hypothetical protein